MTKYQQFRETFKASGLSQKDYALQIGKSPSVVSNNLKRARMDDKTSTNNTFKPLVVHSTPGDITGQSMIRITTSHGVIIELPS